MRVIPGLLVSLFVITQTGCVQTTNFANVEPQLKEWQKSQEYGRLLDTLVQIDPRDPDYRKAAKLRKQVEKQAAGFEQQVLKETQQKQEKEDWASALDQYDEALGKHPRSVIIKDGLVELHQQQRNSLDVLEQVLLIQRGEWLRDVLPIYRDIARVDPRNKQAQNRYQRIVDQAIQISAELALLGNKALADNNLDIAEKRLSLAVTLNNDPVTEESLKAVRAQRKLAETRQLESRRLKEKKAQADKQKKKRNLGNLVKRYDKAFASQDFIAARKHLIAIEKLDRRYDRLAAMKAALKTSVDDKVSHLFGTGVSAYSRGEYEQAAKNWRAVLKLDASHQQAKENLQRAEKVLEKLKQLKDKQGT